MATRNSFNCKTLFVLIDLNESIVMSKLPNQIHSQGCANGTYNSSSGSQKIFNISSTVGNNLTAIKKPISKWSIMTNFNLFLTRAVS